MAGDDFAYPISIVVRFNDRINAQDLAGLAALMTDDHTFVDSTDSTVDGKPACVEAWRGFFAAFPDYRNVFTTLSAEGEVVTIGGHSLCAEPALAGPARWEATIRGDKISRWQVYAD